MLIKTENTDLGLYTIDNRQADLPPGARSFVELPTYTCSHCQRVVVMNPERQRPRYTCRGCSHMICDGCAAIREAGAPCKTFKQVIDEALENAERHSQLILP